MDIKLIEEEARDYVVKTVCREKGETNLSVIIRQTEVARAISYGIKLGRKIERKSLTDKIKEFLKNKSYRYMYKIVIPCKKKTNPILDFLDTLSNPSNKEVKE